LAEAAGLAAEAAGLAAAAGLAPEAALAPEAGAAACALAKAETANIEVIRAANSVFMDFPLGLLKVFLQVNRQVSY
jgi:hypothetical protein